MAAILNQIEFKKKLDGVVQSKQMIGLAKSAANTRAVFAKQAALEEFDDNIVIKELKESVANPSITNSSIISKGNLAAGLGFYKGDNPTEQLRNFISQNLSIANETPKITIGKSTVTYSFRVHMPSKADLDEHFSTLEWTNRSWIDIIENGISQALKKYIFWSEGFGDKSGSRSTTGLQYKGKGEISNVATLKPTKFITEILKKFKEKFI